MKWKNEPHPVSGDTRVIKVFLLTPKRLGNETRWLEFASIAQRYFEVAWVGTSYWEDLRFVEESL